MICPKCKGKGLVDNPRYYCHSNSEAWEMGIKPTKTCRQCKGSGFIIGNIGEIVDRLRCVVNGVAITPSEAKQILDIITKY